MLRPGAYFILGFPVCVEFNLALAMDLEERWACCLGRHGALRWAT